MRVVISRSRCFRRSFAPFSIELIRFKSRRRGHQGASTVGRFPKLRLDRVAHFSFEWVFAHLIQRICDTSLKHDPTHFRRAVNTELVTLYWTIGREIIDQQESAGWGDNVVGRIAQDLALEADSSRGFSRRNVFYMRQFARLLGDIEFVPSVMAQISWTQHRYLLDAFGDQPDLYEWYAAKSVQNHWSVRQLQMQMNLRLHERQGSAISNFANTLRPPDDEQAIEAVKDPYIFDFLEMGETAQERELEQALMDDIQKFLVELGAGFAFYGRQRALIVGGQEFFADLIFYHHVLRRFVVIELKTREFQPEYASKMNFYLNAVDEQLRVEGDKESVGIILCTQKNETVAKVALHRMHAPIAVSTWRTDAAALPPVEITEDVSDDAELAQLESVRERLIERVTRKAAENDNAD
jgi:predicted nuclease of restriction endonuclease-like (RecB) superfamily